jgi:HPt (histidine-containing phosphotransfer) domain-containing protein
MNQPSAKPIQSSTESALIEPILLDCEHLLTHAGGDPQLLTHLCVIFLNELPMRMDSLRSAFRNRNYPLAQRALQQLRDALMLIGPGQLSFTAETLEFAMRSRRSRQVQLEWSRLEREMQMLVPQVQRLMLEVSTPRTAVQ